MRTTCAVALCALVAAGCSRAVGPYLCTLEHTSRAAAPAQRIEVWWSQGPFARVYFDSGEDLVVESTAPGVQFLEIGPDRAYLVVLQDVMRIGSDDVLRRWTTARHYSLRPDPDGATTLYQWQDTVGLASSAAARSLRSGTLGTAHPPPSASVWRCQAPTPGIATRLGLGWRILTSG